MLCVRVVWRHPAHAVRVLWRQPAHVCLRGLGVCVCESVCVRVCPLYSSLLKRVCRPALRLGSSRVGHDGN